MSTEDWKAYKFTRIKWKGISIADIENFNNFVLLIDDNFHTKQNVYLEKISKLRFVWELIPIFNFSSQTFSRWKRNKTIEYYIHHGADNKN